MHFQDVRVSEGLDKRPPATVKEQLPAAHRGERGGVASGWRIRRVVGEELHPRALVAVERERPHIRARVEPSACRLRAAADDDSAPGARQSRRARLEQDLRASVSRTLCTNVYTGVKTCVMDSTHCPTFTYIA